jgi:hypothetical protein
MQHSLGELEITPSRLSMASGEGHFRKRRLSQPTRSTRCGRDEHRRDGHGAGTGVAWVYPSGPKLTGVNKQGHAVRRGQRRNSSGETDGTPAGGATKVTGERRSGPGARTGPFCERHIASHRRHLFGFDEPGWSQSAARGPGNRSLSSHAP